jgi:hypothetical protein
MKKLTSFTLSLVLVAGFASFAQADDMKICVSKATDTKAKVCEFDKKDGMCAMVPISFDSGADWSMVKDSYMVSPETAHALMSKKDTISIGSDGTASFHGKKK